MGHGIQVIGHGIWDTGHETFVKFSFKTLPSLNATEKIQYTAQ